MNRKALLAALASFSCPLQASAQDLGVAVAPTCPVNMARAGPICIDKYEASVWAMPPAASGAPRGRRYGAADADYPCSPNGDDCAGKIFAAPVRLRMPSAYITWFQAQQACFNVGKRLPTNAEWQGAAVGTPTSYEPGADDGFNDCNTSTADHAVPTGSRRNCVSSYGLFDMVGNMLEWVADWMQGSAVPFSPSLGTAGPNFGDDFMRGTNPATVQGPHGTNLPSAPVRGGGYIGGSGAGVFAFNARFSPADFGPDGGFRCVL